MSRTFSTNCGSGDSLKVSDRCGFRPNARQILPTVSGEMPACRAMVRRLQCVWPRGVLSSVSVTTSSTLSSETVTPVTGTAPMLVTVMV